MDQHDTFARALTSLHRAALDDDYWPEASAAIDKACGATGNRLVVARSLDDPDDEVEIDFAGFYTRGHRLYDLERLYFRDYYPCDEGLPRLRRLHDGHVVRVNELYTDEELKTSLTYNEWLSLVGSQNGLVVRLDGLPGSCMVYSLNDPANGSAWATQQIEVFEGLLPHVRHFVAVRQTVAGAQALGASLTHLLDNTGVGVICLNHDGRIVEVNDRARVMVSHDKGLDTQEGFLRAWMRDDNARLQQMLGQALGTSGDGVASGGTMTVGRPFQTARLVVHVSPVHNGLPSLGQSPVAALVLVVDPTSPLSIDAALVAEALGLTRTQGRVAAMLAEGMTVRGISEVTGRTEETTRWHVRSIFSKLGIVRQAELLLRVLSLSRMSDRSRRNRP